MKILRAIYFLLSLFLLVEATFNITKDNKGDKYIKSCNYINHTIQFSVNSSDNFTLIQPGQEFPFKSELSENGNRTYTLNVSETKIKAGPATLIQKTKGSGTNEIDLIFTEYSFQPEIDAEKQYDTIKIIPLQCSGAGDYIKIHRVTEEGELAEKLNSTIDKCGYSLSNALPGVYHIIAENPYIKEDIFVKKFTQIKDSTDSNKHKLHFDFPMPTLPDKSSPITITYPSSLSKIKTIRIKKNDGHINTEVKTEPYEGHYFTIEEYGDNYIVKVYINYDGSDSNNIHDIYQITTIVFSNYQEIHFNNNEIQVGYLFSISKQYYLNKNEIEVILDFKTSGVASEYKNNIVYKQLDGSSNIVGSTCTQNGPNLKCKVKSNGASLIGIGIGKCLLSSQKISVFSYTVKTPEIIENNCMVANSINSEDDLTLFLDFPRDGLPTQLEAHLLNEYNNNDAMTCFVNFDKTIRDFNVNCELSKLSAGHYYFTLVFDRQINSPMTIEDVNIEIKKDYKIKSVEPNVIYRMSTPQKLTIRFDQVVKKGEITKIKLVQNKGESREYSVIDDSDSNIKKVNLVDLDQQELPFGEYYIYFNSPCNTSSFISSNIEVELKENEILSVTPDYLVLEDRMSSVNITFKHIAGHKLDKLIFIHDVSYMYDSEISITNPSDNYIIVPASAFSQQGSYIIQMKYSDKIFNTSNTLYVFYDKIKLLQTIDLVKIPSNLTYIRIPLEHSVPAAQILKITSKSEGSNEEKECEFSVPALEERIINVTPNFELDTIGTHEFYIYDKLSDEPLKYTIECSRMGNLPSAQIDISIKNPAENGTNTIGFTFHDYDASNIQTIVFKKVSFINGEETPMKFCKEGVSGCYGTFEKTNSEINHLSVDIVIGYNDLYLYKYVLTSISDKMVSKNYINDQYVLTDFSMSQNIFGFLEGDELTSVKTRFNLYSVSAANATNNEITCEMDTKCDINGEDCKESCENVCDRSCRTECEQDGNELVCTFIFGNVKKEGTVLYKLGDADNHYKPLHLIRIVPPEHICKLSNFDDHLNMKICSYYKPNNIALYFNDQITINCECDCYGYDIHWNDNDNDNCTDITIPYRYATDKMQIQAMRNKNKINSFILETSSEKLTLLQEIMQNYQGKLTAQIDNLQRVKYIFHSDSDASKIEQITLTHRTNGITIITNTTDPEVCTAKNNELDCYYYLHNKTDVKDLGLYDISYIHSNCKEEFRFANAIEIEEPPIKLLDVSPPESCLCSSEEFDLNYNYYFYEGSCKIPKSVTLVNPNDEREYITVNLFSKTSGSSNLPENYYRKHLYFNTPFNFKKMGYFYVIEHFNGCLEDKIHKDKRILFYLHEIEISPPNVTYNTDEPIPESTTTFFVNFPIIIEQISSVTLEGKTVEYEFFSNRITFLFTNNIIDFTKGGEHNIIITTIKGSTVTFTVFVNYVKTLSESEILIEGPTPGYENTTNIIHFFSPDYNLTKLTRIVFSTPETDGGESELVVDRNTIIENYCVDNNTLNLPIHLPHGTSYTYKGVYNDNLNEVNEKGKGSYTLKGFFIEQHFFFLKSTSVIYYHLNFYTNEMAQIALGKIRENNVINKECIIMEDRNHIIQCPHRFPANQEKSPLTLNISIYENATDDKILPIHIMSAKLEENCFANKFTNQEITLSITSVTPVGTVIGNFDKQIVNSVGIKKPDHYLSLINFEFPKLYEYTELSISVDFERNGSIYHLEVPNSKVTFINYAEVSEIPTQYINPFDKEKILKIKLTHDVSDSDLSDVVLENIKNNNDKITINNCSIKSDVHENDVYTCDVSQIKNYNTYLVHVYDSCGKELNPIGKFYVYFTDEFNFLQQLSQKAVRYSELSDTTFTLTYNSSLKSLPQKIELFNYNDDTPSKYKVEFVWYNEEGNTIYLRAKISGSKQIGLFRVKSTFDPEKTAFNVDYSPLTILIYDNEIALSKTTETYPYGTSITTIKISLVNPIIIEQIYQITYQIHDKDPLNGIVVDWALNSSKEIIVYFEDELKLEDNYVISIIPATDEANDVTFALNAFVSYNFEFSREYIDMGDEYSFTMVITPLDDYEHNIAKIESNDDEAVVSRNQKIVYNYDNKGNYISSETHVWYEVKYTKGALFTLPKEIKFKYYFQNVAEPYDISQSIYITDSYHPFFDYGPYIGKTYYRGSKFEIILTSTRNIDYTGLNAYLTNGINEWELQHNKNDPKKFYLITLTDIEVGEMELIIYEKGDRTAIVDQGQMFTFSEKSSPEIGNNGCFNNGKLIGKYCKCPNGYYGKTCSIEEEDVNDFTNGYIDEVGREEEGSGEETENGESGENGVVAVDPNFLSKSSEVVAIGMQRTVIVPNVNDELIKRFKATYPTTEEEAEGYFSLASILIEGIKNGGTRRLSEEQRYDILKRTKEVATEWDLKDKPFTTFELRLQNIYYHKIKATSDAFEQYRQSNTEWKPSFIEIPNIDDIGGYYLLSANEEHGEYNPNKKQSKVSMEFEYYPSDAYRRMLSENGNDELLVHFSLQDFSIPEDDIATYYSKKGINLFNTNEPFFTDKCYSVDPDKFDFDLTHKYRMKLYPNASFELNDDYNCKYKGMGVIPEYMTYTCSSPKLSNKVTVNMELKEKELSKDQTESSIPLKCVGQITKVYNNIGFWLFFLLILLMINAILFILFMKHVITKETTSTNPPDAVSQGALQQKQNGIVVTDDNRSTQGKNVFKKVSNTITVNDKSPRGEADKLPTLAQGQIQLQVQDGYSPYDDEETPSSFVQWLLYNLKRYHPIPANYFCKERYLQIPIFVFSITTMFAFNAILFKESYIDARVTNKSRNSFGYPLAHEAGAVFGAIFIAWIFSAIPKTIYYFLMEKELSELIKKILSISFIAVITVLMFIWWIYSIGFCGVYKNTQFGWFYACIWSLFFDWILFAPVFVVAVSFVNYKFPALKPDLIKMIKEIARF